MLVHHDDDEWEAVSSHRTCGFHKLQPGMPYAGCTCSSSYGQRRRTPGEIAKIKADKRKAREDAVLAEADLIRTHRKGE